MESEFNEDHGLRFASFLNMVRNSSVSFDMVVLNKGVEHEAVALAVIALFVSFVSALVDLSMTASHPAICVPYSTTSMVSPYNEYPLSQLFPQPYHPACCSEFSSWAVG